eukprot:86032-Amphidinium_carterae.1
MAKVVPFLAVFGLLSPACRGHWSGSPGWCLSLQDAAEGWIALMREGASSINSDVVPDSHSPPEFASRTARASAVKANPKIMRRLGPP